MYRQENTEVRRFGALAVAFVVHASVAELWIRATRRSSSPKVGKVKAV
jgi:hypothetical protein